MSMAKQRAIISRELSSAQTKLAKCKADQAKADVVAAAMVNTRTFSLASLGDGKERGGGVAAKKNRMIVMDHVRRCAVLSPEQDGQWAYFKEVWDETMAYWM